MHIAMFALLLLAGSVLSAPPTMPTTFYGVINTTGGTPAGQTITAALGASSASATVNATNLYSCGGSTCNYYLSIGRADGDTTSTNVSFTINSHNIGNGTFSEGGVTRLDFANVPESYLAGGVVGGANDIVANGTGTIAITINGTSPNVTYNATLPVNISAGGNVILSFSYNFSAALLNFSNINISNGTSGGKAYVSVSGVNNTGGQSGTKTLLLYGASSIYNGVCIRNIEGAGYSDISSTCTGTNETAVNCNGTAVSGITCTSSGTTRTISGLLHSAIIQYNVSTNATTTTTSSTTSGTGGSGSSGRQTQPGSTVTNVTPQTPVQPSTPAQPSPPAAPEKKQATIISPPTASAGDSITLTLVDAAGVPISGAKITVTDPNGNRLEYTTDSSGQVKFTALAEGTYTYAAEGVQLTAAAQTSATKRAAGTQAPPSPEQGAPAPTAPAPSAPSPLGGIAFLVGAGIIALVVLVAAAYILLKKKRKGL